jgi:hypothetical protein
LKFANEGKIYIGGFKDDLMHGEGVMLMTD